MYIGFIAIDSSVYIEECNIKAEEVNIFSLGSLYINQCGIKYIPDLCFPIEIDKTYDNIIINIKFITAGNVNGDLHNYSVNIIDYLKKYPDTEEIRIGIDNNSHLYIWLYSYFKCELINIEHNLPIVTSIGFNRFNYRYFFEIDIDGLLNSEVSYVEEKLLDGTHDKLHNECPFYYHNASIPEKLKVTFSNDNNIWSLFYWFNDIAIIKIFSKFYGAHPDTKTDFIIRIDAENKKYELALYRQGLKEPVVIPESAYQLIVFKNKFEDYRSENYNQPRGAWIW